jgi:hypothetical protein
MFGLLEPLNRGDGRYYSISAENQRLDRLAAKLPDGCSAFYVAGSSLSDDFGEQDSMHDAILVSLKPHIPSLNGKKW